jgi:ribonuclease HII
VGRGCLAGPVVAAAVVLDPAVPIEGLADSKLLSARARDRLSEAIRRHALAWAIGEVGVAEIDRIHIQRAAAEAMRQAVMALVPLPGMVLVDAFRIPELPMAQRAVIHGDRLIAAIAAASIVAKVHRDRAMTDLDASDPRYGFARHKGYGTADHLAALTRFGYSNAHRRSFRPASLFDSVDGPASGERTG